MNTNNTKQKGFIVKMSDGQRFLIPFDRFIQDEIKRILEAWNHEQSYKASPQEASEWATAKFENLNPDYEDEIIMFLEGLSWDDVKDTAIQLPSELMTLSEMFDSAEVSLSQ